MHVRSLYRFSLTLLLFSTLPSTHIHAATIEWINPLGGAFENGSNWNSGTPPGPGDSTTVPPTPADDARFNLDQTYTVTFPVVPDDDPGTPEDESMLLDNNSATVNFGDVTFDLNSQIYNLNSNLIIGDVLGDNAMLTITNGTVNTSFARVGFNAGSTGTFNIGNNGILDGNISISQNQGGNGIVNVSNGGIVTGGIRVNTSNAVDLNVAEINVNGIGTLVQDRIVVNNSSVLNVAAGAQLDGGITFGQGSSANINNSTVNGGIVATNLDNYEHVEINVSNGSTLTGDINLRGQPSLDPSQGKVLFNINSGSTLNSDSISIFDNSELTLSGMGSSIINSGLLQIIGAAAFVTDKTTLSVLDGALLTTEDLLIDGTLSSFLDTTELIVDNASLQTTNSLIVDTNANLIIQNGGQVISNGSEVTLTSHPNGQAIVDGIGSHWMINTSDFTIGQSFTSTAGTNLIIRNGGKVTSNSVGLGANFAFSGNPEFAARVEGLGSTWNTNGTMTIGTDPTGLATSGRLDILSQGTVNVTNNIDLFNGSINIDGGHVNVGTNLAIGDAGVVNLSDGSLTSTNIQLNDNGTFIMTGGQLSFITFSDDLSNQGGIVSLGVPAIQTGTALIGSYTQDANSTLFIELAGNMMPDFDQLLAGNDVNLDGTLQISLLDNFLPAIGDSFDIIIANSIIGTFNTLLAPDIADIRWELQYLVDEISPNGDVVRLVAAAVPLPPAIWLFSSALALLFFQNRRKA